MWKTHCIISVRVHKTSLTQPLFIEVPVLSQDSNNHVKINFRFYDWILELCSILLYIVLLNISEYSQTLCINKYGLSVYFSNQLDNKFM